VLLRREKRESPGEAECMYAQTDGQRENLVQLRCGLCDARTLNEVNSDDQTVGDEYRVQRLTNIDLVAI